MAAPSGGSSIAVNALGVMYVQGTPLADLSRAEYEHPIVANCANTVPHLSTPGGRGS